MTKASKIDSELTSATLLIPILRDQIAAEDADGAAATVDQIRVHTTTARETTGHPLWALASALPQVGVNLSAVTEVANSADDVANLALGPLVEVHSSLKWETLVPGRPATDLTPLEVASPTINAAADTVRFSADRLHQLDVSGLLPQVADPLTTARDQLQDLAGVLDAAADAATIAPDMLGAHTGRNYLLMVQNNAEVRASGGIPGALAVLSLNMGSLTLDSQTSAGDIGVMSPTLPLDPEQQQIYSGRLGKFMQDVNLTPDFPTAASTAQGMWERKSGARVDGVISIDPVALSYILEATGPVKITQPELAALTYVGLPTELTSTNVIPTLLSDVYSRIENPTLQDAYFAGIARAIFAALSDDGANAKDLIAGISRGASEGRVLVWSGHPAEQTVIAKYAFSGSINGPNIAPAQFGVYFNDGTGAKMDYYVERTVKLIKECSRDGYEQTTVRISSTNTAPMDAATSLPRYVTGDGVFGVPPGSVQTNLVAYGPIQANVETAKVDGEQTPFAPFVHSKRPVGVVAIQLAPGETKTVEFTFGKIVQHTEPILVVTPTVQPVNDVLLPTEKGRCD